MQHNLTNLIDFYIMLCDARTIKVQANSLTNAFDKAAIQFGYATNIDDDEDASWDDFLQNINMVEYKTPTERIIQNFKTGGIKQIYQVDSPYVLDKYTDTSYLIQKPEAQ